ncbi:dimethylargininase [Actinoplanes philippinensis]|uniref:dimethylargininase n=1 Tax=Actinoplanes philippinensis TaxID=35752 RepID=UPI0033D41CD4
MGITLTSTVSIKELNSTRIARPRHVLMCEPTYFDVCYSINPWMDPSRPTSTRAGISQWKKLHDLFVELGHRVDLVPARPGLPDMVFAANGATVIDGKVLVARFRHAQRQGESAAFAEWFRQQGWGEVRTAGHDNEGEGDILFTGNEILAGKGFRTAASAHGEVRSFFDREVVGLTLVDPRFYHLDTALAVIDTGEVMYYPDAFDGPSRELLAERFPDSILATERDAEVFGLNAFSDGRHVVLPEAATGLAGQLAERGFEPIGVGLGELLKAGGSVKCCTLELRRFSS